MKTFTKKIMVSIIAVAFAFIALGTSTFAWFAMNTKVTATGMEVGVKSNNTYLLIGNEYDTNDATTIEAIKDANENTTVTFTLTAAQSTVLPSKPLEASEIGADQTDNTKPAEGKRFASGTPVTDYATAAAPANWYTAANGNPAYADDSIKDEHKLCSSDTQAADYDADYVFSNYVIKRTVYLTLATGANDANNLTVKASISLKEGQSNEQVNISAVKVLVVTDSDNMITLDASQENNNQVKNLYTAQNNTTLTDHSLVKVDIYVYYDGSEAAVYTNNAAVLAAAKIDLAFGVTVIND